MTKIFQPWPDNFHYPVLWGNPADFFACADLNFKHMASDWRQLSFDFYKDGKPDGREPDIVFLAPCLAVKKGVERTLFVGDAKHFEFLPISIGGSDWILVNCLNVLKQYDEERSIFHRDSSGVIFMVQKLVIENFPADACEVFTLANSNRSSVFVTESFVDRVKQLGLKGLRFKPIGEAN